MAQGLSENNGKQAQINQMNSRFDKLDEKVDEQSKTLAEIHASLSAFLAVWKELKLPSRVNDLEKWKLKAGAMGAVVAFIALEVLSVVRPLVAKYLATAF
jgi:hypothetical protein